MADSGTSGRQPTRQRRRDDNIPTKTFLQQLLLDLQPENGGEGGETIWEEGQPENGNAAEISSQASTNITMPMTITIGSDHAESFGCAYGDIMPQEIRHW